MLAPCPDTGCGAQVVRDVVHGGVGEQPQRLGRQRLALLDGEAEGLESLGALLLVEVLHQPHDQDEQRDDASATAQLLYAPQGYIEAVLSTRPVATPTNVERLRDELDVPILYVSHSVSEVARLADRVVVLADGRVEASGGASDILGGAFEATGREAGSVLSGRVVPGRRVAIIGGTVLGGVLINPSIASSLAEHPLIAPLAQTRAEVAILLISFIYLSAALCNLLIPRTNIDYPPQQKNPILLLKEFRTYVHILWRDKLGQISLATTTLFWGVSGNLRYIVLAWAAVALNYDTTKASALVGVVAIGTAVGAVWASVKMRLDRATLVIPLGVAMGLLVLGMNFLRDITVTVPFMILLGGLGGFLVVPMNALLQHRGHNLMGAGRSIAVQNFNEQACILVLGLMYTGLTSSGLSAYGAITAFGLFVASTMLLIGLWHRRNVRQHPDELARLLEIARSDGHHHHH